MHDDETVVSDLVAQALEHRDETGTEIDLEALCGQRPDLQTKVENALKAATRLPMLQSSGVEGLPPLGEALAGRYRIDERLGAGAMGVVYSATDTELGRPVAIKVLHHGVMERSQALARFEREAEALAAVRQESVVTIHDRGHTEDGAPYLVMELVEGIPLSGILDVAEQRQSDGADIDRTDWLSETFGFEALAEPSFLRQAALWAKQLAEGLEAIHAAGIVHRDIKPSNIVVRWDGRPVILDFGAVLTEEESNLTRTGAAVGTPAYMAPEALQRHAKEVAEPAADIYGLSATLYHLVTVRPPYAGTPSQILASLATRDPAPARRLRAGLPRDLEAVLDKGMARRPRQRYETAAALCKDLDLFLNYRPVAARRVTTIERVGRRLARSRALRGGLVVVLVLMTILGWRAWSAAQEARRNNLFAGAELRVPANYGVVTFANRVVADAELTEELGVLFDELVASGGSPVVAGALRASYRLDHGRPAGAADDMERVAREVGTPYARELAARYRSLPGGATSARELSLEGLPEPKDPMDHYLAGFHAMRGLRYGDAEAHLAVEGLSDVRHAQELRLLLDVIPIARLEGNERFVAGGKLYEKAIQLEARFGSRSSMSAHLAGYGLSAQARYEEALPICQEGLALAPAAHSTSVNAARDAYRTFDFAEARRWILHSTRLLPHYPRAYETGLLVRVSAKDYGGAREYLSEIPYSGSARDQRTKLTWELRIATDEALSALEAGEGDLAKTQAASVLEVAKKPGQNLVGDARTYASLCEAIVGGDRSSVFRLLCERQEDDPLWPDSLRTLFQLMPPVLDADSRQSLIGVLEAISDALGRRRSEASAG